MPLLIKRPHRDSYWSGCFFLRWRELTEQSGHRGHRRGPRDARSEWCGVFINVHELLFEELFVLFEHRTRYTWLSPSPASVCPLSSDSSGLVDGSSLCWVVCLSMWSTDWLKLRTATSPTTHWKLGTVLCTLSKQHGRTDESLGKLESRSNKSTTFRFFHKNALTTGPPRCWRRILQSEAVPLC